MGQQFPHRVKFIFAGGEILDHFSVRSRISPLVGKLMTVSKMGQQFPHHEKFIFTGGEILDRFSVWPSISEQKNGQESPHQ